MQCFFVSDLHGNIENYNKLIESIEKEHPDAVFIGGDLTKAGIGGLVSNSSEHQSFIKGFLINKFGELKQKMKSRYPEVYIILGNDDLKKDEEDLAFGENLNVWHYLNQNKIHFKGFNIYGYPFVPPTPFLLKDFEKYDVSQYVDPGCVAPEDGSHSYELNKALLKRDTIKRDIEKMTDDLVPESSIFLFHSPPYKTKLDRADLDGKFYHHVPLDVHIGSIAIKEFIKNKQPKITLHGHVHESTRLSGSWKEQLGKTSAFSAAHDGNELCLVRFNPHEPENATRQLL